MPILGQCPILGHCHIFGTVPRARGSGLLVEKEAQSYKKMCSLVHIRTSRKRKASGLQFGDFHERFLDGRKAVRSVEAHSKALIKLEKTREEPKSSEAGERKELMLKSKTLESICWSFGSLAMHTRGNEAPA